MSFSLLFSGLLISWGFKDVLFLSQIVDFVFEYKDVCELIQSAEEVGIMAENNKK